MNVSHLNMVRRMAVVVWALALVASLTACSYFTDVTSAGAELELAGDAMPEVANASASEFNNEGSIYLKGTFILVTHCTATMPNGSSMPWWTRLAGSNTSRNCTSKST